MRRSGGLATAGATFLLVQGTFDGICAGILLHLGFCLLNRDFPHDVAAHCTGRHGGARRSALYLALWGGAGLMAFIGRYL